MARKHPGLLGAFITSGALLVLAAATAHAACSVAPLGTCVGPSIGGKAVLRLKNTGTPAANKVVWRAAILPQQLAADVGTGADDYELCLYDAGVLIVDSLLPGGAGWTIIGDNVRYVAASPFLPDGVRVFKWLNDPAAGKFVLKAKGVNLYATLGPPSLPVTGPLLAQVVNNVSGMCLESAFATISNPGPPTAKAFLP